MKSLRDFMGNKGKDFFNFVGAAFIPSFMTINSYRVSQSKEILKEAYGGKREDTRPNNENVSKSLLNSLTSPIAEGGSWYLTLNSSPVYEMLNQTTGNPESDAYGVGILMASSLFRGVFSYFYGEAARNFGEKAKEYADKNAEENSKNREIIENSR